MKMKELLQHKSFGLKTALAVLVICSPVLSSAADQMPPPPQPDAGLIGSHERNIVLEIKFAADGHVASCKTVDASGAPQLARQTATFIRKNWNCPTMAGHTARVPIDYHPAAAVASQPTSNAPASSPSTPSAPDMPQQLGGGYGGGGGGGSSMGGGRGPAH